MSEDRKKASVTEHLPRKKKGLGLIPSTVKKKGRSTQKIEGPLSNAHALTELVE